MPLATFSVDVSSLSDLADIFEQAPKQFTAATGMLLNQFAFGTRDEALRLMPQIITIRDPRFLKRQLRVQKSKFKGSLGALESVFGSVHAPRFTGWKEQQLGKKTPRHRVFTTLGRVGGTTKGKASRGARLRDLAKFPRPEDYIGQSDEHRAIVMLRVLQRQKFNRPFIIHGHRKISPGVYKFKGRGSKKKPRPIKMLQSFKPRKVQPRRIDWLLKSRNKYFARVNTFRLWEQVLTRAWKPKKTK
jgi:hypothetical protein